MPGGSDCGKIGPGGKGVIPQPFPQFPLPLIFPPYPSSDEWQKPQIENP